MVTNKIVLLIDDSPICLELITHFLKPFGFRILSTSSARNGLKIALEKHPCVVLCDMHMPDWNGFDFAENFLQDERLRDIPLAAITGAHSIFGDRLAALEAGYQEVFYKPLNESIVPKINALCLNQGS